MGQEFRHSLASYPCLTVSHKPATGCQPRLIFHLKVQLGKDLPLTLVTLFLAKFSSLGAGRLRWESQFLAGYWLEATLSSLPHGLSNIAADFTKATQKAICQQDSVIIFLQHFLIIVLLCRFGSKLLRGRGLYKAINTRSQGSLAAVLEAPYHNWV